MNIKLYHRHHGIHTFLRGLTVDLSFHEDAIDEQKIVDLLPEGWLGEKVSKTLLTVGNETGSQACRNPKLFRPWGKYFDSYVLEISK